MKRHTHGRCWKCKVIYRWERWPLLRDARCPSCGYLLSRTAASLATSIPVVDVILARLGTPEYEALAAKAER